MVREKINIYIYIYIYIYIHIIYINEYIYIYIQYHINVIYSESLMKTNEEEAKINLTFISCRNYYFTFNSIQIK